EMFLKARIILEAFFRQALNHSAIYEAPDGTKFPYTVIRVDELAADLLQLEAATQKRPERVSRLDGSQQTFVFPSSLQPANGHPFTFIEYTMDGAVRALPAALAAARSGQKSESQEFVIFGSPTQEWWGAMSPQLIADTQKNAFATFGKMYAEAMRALVPSRPDEKNHAIKFEGSSMGASLAAATAAEFKKGLQQSGEPLPNLSVQMDAPVGLVTATYGESSKAELNALFGVEGVCNLSAAGMKTFFGEKDFLKEVKQYFAQHGGMPEVAENSPAEKQAMIDTLIGELADGVPVDPELDITAIEGRADLLMTPLSRLRTETREKLAGVFGNSLSKRKYPRNVKLRRVPGGHNEAFNFMRPEKVQALWAAAQAFKFMRLDK
ncbi:MAG: hypothetical protein V2A63_04180, partial [Patescibacteria group bacterium]